MSNGVPPVSVYRDELDQMWNEGRRERQREAAEWPDHLPPLDDAPVPPFPNILPDWVASYCQQLAAATETPVDLPSMLALATAATALAGRVTACGGGTWRESVNLYVMIGMESASGKSLVFRELIHPVITYEQLMEESGREQRVAVNARRKVLEEQEASLRTQIRKAKSGSDVSQLEQELIQVARQLEATPFAQKPQLLADDVTPEALVKLLQGRERISLLSPEGGELVRIMSGRYSSNTPNIGIFLKGYSGESYQSDRVGRGSVSLQNPLLTLGLSVQPSVIRDLVRTQEFVDRGLVGRFLYCMPESLVGSRTYERPPVEPVVEERYRSGIRHLLDMEVPMELGLDCDAVARLKAMSLSMEGRVGESGDLHFMQEWCGRMGGTALRIAGLLHFLGGGGDVIDVTTADKAARFTQHYLLPHARRAYRSRDTGEQGDNVLRLARAIRKLDRYEFRERDLHQKVKGQTAFRKKAGMEPALQVLAELEYLKRDGKGGCQAHPGWIRGELEDV